MTSKIGKKCCGFNCPAADALCAKKVCANRIRAATVDSCISNDVVRVASSYLPEPTFELSTVVQNSSPTVAFTYVIAASNLNAISFSVECSEDVPGNRFIEISVTSPLVASGALGISGSVPVACFNSALTTAYTNGGVIGIARLGISSSTSPPGTVKISMRASSTNLWDAGQTMGFNVVFNWFKNPTPVDDLCIPLGLASENASATPTEASTTQILTPSEQQRLFDADRSGDPIEDNQSIQILSNGSRPTVSVSSRRARRRDLWSTLSRTPPPQPPRVLATNEGIKRLRERIMRQRQLRTV